MGQLCSVCGHGIYFHVKGGVLDPQGCVVGGLLCANHTFATSVTATLDHRLTKANTQTEPTAYFPVNGNGNDVAAFNSDGVWTGTEAYTTGIVPPTSNGAADFDGASFVTLPNEDKYDFDRLDAFSISLWTKSPANASGQALVAKRETAMVAGWELRLTTSKTLRFILTNTLNTNEIDVTGSSVFADDIWHHTVMSYDGSTSASGVNIYHDGVKDDSITITDDNLNSSIVNNTAVSIGARSAGALPFTGQMDNLAIWDFEVNQEMINNLYNEGTGLTILSQ